MWRGAPAGAAGAETEKRTIAYAGREIGLGLQILVELAELQDQEVGDGTTSVVIIAAELLKRANNLVRNKIHPTSVIAGYRLAMREACKYVEESMAVNIDTLGKDVLLNCAKTSMSSKCVAYPPPLSRDHSLRERREQLAREQLSKDRRFKLLL